MRKSINLLFFVLLGFATSSAQAGCAFMASVAGNISGGSPFIAELQDNQGNVLAKLGPLGAGQNQNINISCPSSSVHAVFISQQNTNQQFQSANSIIMTNGQQAYCGLNNSFTYTLNLRQCTGCMYLSQYH